MQLDGSLRRLYKHTDGYLRAVHTMCETSRVLADDFYETLDNPAMRSAAEQFATANEVAVQMQMNVLTQLLHRKVFKPVRREVDGRKELDKRISDRKKVRADYDAYRRKQQHQLQSDPTNAAMYEANLEAARRTFEKHSSLVAHDLSAVAKERDLAVCEAFMALVASQRQFFTSVAATLDELGSNCAKSFEASPGATQSWGAVQQELSQLKATAKPPPPKQRAPPQREAAPSARAAARGAPSVPSGPAGSTQYVPPTVAGPGPPTDPPARAAPAASARRPNPPVAEVVAEVDLLGGLGSSPAAPRAAAAAPTPPPEEEVDLLSGMGGGTPPGGAGGAGGGAGGSPSADADLLSGFGAAPPAVGGGSSSYGSVSDIMGNDSTGMDDLFSLGAAAPLMPDAAATAKPRNVHRSASMTHTAPDDDFFMMGAPPGSAPPGSAPPGRSMAGVSSRPSSQSQPSLASDPFNLGSFGGAASEAPPPGGGDRAFYANRREAQKQAAIDEKVEKVRQQNAKAEADRDLEQQLERGIAAKVQAWQREKKNLRALLASLHEIAPPCSWKPMTLGELLDAANVKKGYRKALLAVHPDKQPKDDIAAKVLAQHVFDALRDAWILFEKMG